MNKLKKYSRELRNNGTKAEAILWKYLLSRKQTEYRFLRQYVIRPYIVDFFCYELQLVIEIDGSSHENKSEYDFKREVYIQSKGLKVIRYKEKDVLNSLGNVRRSIFHTIYCVSQEENHNNKASKFWK